jgi:hypothetical protein
VGGKRYFAAVKLDASPKFDRKSPNSRYKKIGAVKRETIKRPIAFKSDGWYEKAALSIKISAQAVTSAE